MLEEGANKHGHLALVAHLASLHGIVGFEQCLFTLLSAGDGSNPQITFLGVLCTQQVVSILGHDSECRVIMVRNLVERGGGSVV